MGGGCNLTGVGVIFWGQLQPHWGKCNLTGVGATLGDSCNPVGPGGIPVLVSSHGVGGVGGKAGSARPSSTPGLGAAPGNTARAHTHTHTR